MQKTARFTVEEAALPQGSARIGIYILTMVQCKYAYAIVIGAMLLCKRKKKINN